jgi:hypothetical protein
MGRWNVGKARASGILSPGMVMVRAHKNRAGGVPVITGEVVAEGC